MTFFIVGLLVAAQATTVHLKAADNSAKNRPVTKVINLMKDMIGERSKPKHLLGLHTRTFNPLPEPLS